MPTLLHVVGPVDSATTVEINNNRYQEARPPLSRTWVSTAQVDALQPPYQMHDHLLRGGEFTIYHMTRLDRSRCNWWGGLESPLAERGQHSVWFTVHSWENVNLKVRVTVVRVTSINHPSIKAPSKIRQRLLTVHPWGYLNNGHGQHVLGHFQISIARSRNFRCSDAQRVGRPSSTACCANHRIR